MLFIGDYSGALNLNALIERASPSTMPTSAVDVRSARGRGQAVENRSLRNG